MTDHCPDEAAAPRWAVVLAVKLTPGAKSRLRPLSADDAAHRELVRAIRADTLAAVRACPLVTRVLIVGDRDIHDRDTHERDTHGRPDGELPIDVLQHTPGLNGAFADGVAQLRRDAPEQPVAALVADLPALRPDDLRQALILAADHPRGFVRDTVGTGTTMVTARDSTTFISNFGPGSAQRHAADMAELPAAAGLRSDIDTPADLRAAVGLGVGAHTASLLARVGYASFTSTRHD